jgi:importin subunit alpha-1
VPHFVRLLAHDANPRLQFEAAWALTNIASGTTEHTQAVIAAGAMPPFVRLLDSESDDVREQVVWALGNIAGDSTVMRDLVLDSGALAPLLRRLVPDAKLGFIRNATWTVSNFCRGKPAPNFDKVRDALPTLAALIYEEDKDVLTDALWALSYLSDSDRERLAAVLEAGVVPRIVELLAHPQLVVKIPALRTIGNIATGDDLQTQAVVEAGALPHLLKLLASEKNSVKREACWTISNIMAGAAGAQERIQVVLDAGAVPMLIHLLQHGKLDVKKEACWALSNATSGGSAAQIAYLVGQGAVFPMTRMLEVEDSHTVMVALEGLENVGYASATALSPGSHALRTLLPPDLLSSFHPLCRSCARAWRRLSAPVARTRT